MCIRDRSGNAVNGGHCSRLSASTFVRRPSPVAVSRQRRAPRRIYARAIAVDIARKTCNRTG
eukprot:7401871-Lingulodinium_polyedra.AAC.1